MNTIVVGPSRFPFAETVARLKDAIGAGGATLFAEIDQRQAAAGAGLELRPTTLLLFGNPRGGTPLMLSWPLAAIELPLRLLVWEEDGSVSVAHPRMSAALARVAVPTSRAESMDLLLDGLLKTIV
jgi:uncharacterized protein (DUF302 family)